MPEIQLKFVYENGIADKHRLGLYDSAVSLEGIARALAITTHAFVNKGQIRTRGDSAKGAKFYIRPPQRGSVVFHSAIWVGDLIATGIFYDFIKYTLYEVT